MATDGHGFGSQAPTDSAAIVRAVTVIMGAVVGLTFLFGFGNVLNLALRLGVPLWVAPLVAPAVDLSIVGLLLATRHLALAGAPPDVFRSARRLLIFASVVTLALNVAEPLVAGQFGKAAFDAVGPLLLIGWSEVGPGLLQTIGTASRVTVARQLDRAELAVYRGWEDDAAETTPQLDNDVPYQGDERTVDERSPMALLAQARREDAAHRAVHQKPISADKLRVRLRVGAARARRLVKIVRCEFEEQLAAQRPGHEAPVPVIVVAATAVVVLVPVRLLDVQASTGRLEMIRTALAVGAGTGAVMTLVLAWRRQWSTSMTRLSGG